MRVIRDVADLILGRACLACEVSGPSLCAACLALLRAQPRVRVAVRGAAGCSAVRYRGVARRVVLDYKQHGDRSLARPLGLLLADAVAELQGECADAARVGGWPTGRQVSLVPVPAHRRSRRGFDALGAVAEQVARELTSSGRPARVDRLLRSVSRYPPLKGLSRGERQRQVLGAFTARADTDPRAVILVDDVITTGATIGEAIRALTEGGHRVTGFATVAAADQS